MGPFRAFVVTLLVIAVGSFLFFQAARPPSTTQESTANDAATSGNAAANATPGATMPPASNATALGGSSNESPISANQSISQG